MLRVICTPMQKLSGTKLAAAPQHPATREAVIRRLFAVIRFASLNTETQLCCSMRQLPTSYTHTHTRALTTVIYFSKNTRLYVKTLGKDLAFASGSQQSASSSAVRSCSCSVPASCEPTLTAPTDIPIGNVANCIMWRFHNRLCRERWPIRDLKKIHTWPTKRCIFLPELPTELNPHTLPLLINFSNNDGENKILHVHLPS